MLAEMTQDKLLQMKQLPVLNEYITSLPSYFGVRIPGYGLDTKQSANATERADLFKLLPVAILAFPSIKGTFLQTIQGKCFCNARCCDVHLQTVIQT